MRYRKMTQPDMLTEADADLNLGGDGVEAGPRAAQIGGTKSPTARSLELLRQEGYAPFVVEWFDQRAQKRRDLFGFLDILALGVGHVLGVQSCIRNDIATRVAKIVNHRNLPAVRRAGVRIQVWGWGLMASGQWEVRIVDLTEESQNQALAAREAPTLPNTATFPAIAPWSDPDPLAGMSDEEGKAT